MRAYGGCAAECLRQASKTRLLESVRVQFAMGFAQLPRLRARLVRLGAAIESEDFANDGFMLRLCLPTKRRDVLRTLLAALSRGQVELRVLD